MSRIIPLYFWLVVAIIAANPLLINATKYILIKIVDEEEHAGKILDISILIISYDLKIRYICSLLYLMHLYWPVEGRSWGSSSDYTELSGSQNNARSAGTIKLFIKLFHE